MHEADNAYAIRSTWLCDRQVQFLKTNYNSQHTKGFCCSTIVICITQCVVSVQISFFGVEMRGTASD